MNNIEIERKFKVSDTSIIKNLIGVDIQQYYISEGVNTVRIRISENKALLTIKSKPIATAQRYEWEYQIPLKDAQEMANQHGVTYLKKTRYKYEHEGHIFEIDQYHGDLDGLFTAEVELTDSTTNINLPNFIGEEVTGNRKWDNEILAKEGLPDGVFINAKTITNWLEEYYIKDYIINEDLTVDVNGDVDLSNKQLLSIPVKFNKITGGLYCQNNELTSLEFCPAEVGTDFTCYNNLLTSLKGCPNKIGNTFNCADNCLTSLEFCPEHVGRSFLCDGNQLISLKHCPDKIFDNFSCRNNNLNSLEGGPSSVVGRYYCCSNNITTLEFLPEYVGRSFYINQNESLGKFQNMQNLNLLYAEYKKHTSEKKMKKLENKYESSNLKKKNKL